MISLAEKFFNTAKAGKPQDAFACLDKLIEKDPFNPNHYIKKGDLHQKSGDACEAISLYHKAADLMMQSGFHKKAFAVLKIILRIDPADPAAVRNMGKVLAEIEAAERGLVPEQQDVSKALTKDSRDDSQSAFLSGLSNEELEVMLQAARIREYAVGDTVIKEGEPGDSIFVIKEGKVRVTSFFMGKQIELAVLKRKCDIFGEASFLTGRPRTASVIASEYLVVYEIGRQKLEDIIALKPKITEYLNEIYHVRVIETINAVKEKTIMRCEASC